MQTSIFDVNTAIKKLYTECKSLFPDFYFHPKIRSLKGFDSVSKMIKNCLWLFHEEN